MSIMKVAILFNKLSQLESKNINTPEKLLNFMDDIDYGYIDKNEESNVGEIDEKDFYKNYRLQSPMEVIKSKLGVCWDQCELERYVFKKYIKLPFKIYYFELKNENKESHTALIFQKDKKYYWFEHSWNKQKGIHEFDSLKECISKISKLHKESGEPSKGVEVFELKKPKYGISCIEFMNHATHGKKINI